MIGRYPVTKNQRSSKMNHRFVIILTVMALVLTVGSVSSITADVGDNPAQKKVTSASNQDVIDQITIENAIVSESSNDRTLRPSGRNDRGGGPRRDAPGDLITTTEWSHGGVNRYNGGIAYDPDNQWMWLTSYSPAWIGAVSFDDDYQFDDEIDCQQPLGLHPMGAAWYDGVLYVISWANYFLSKWDAEGNSLGNLNINNIMPTAITVSAENGWLFVMHHPSLHIYVLDINASFNQIGLIDDYRSIMESEVADAGEPLTNSYSRSIVWVDNHPNGQLWLNAYRYVQVGADLVPQGNRAWQFEIDDDWFNSNDAGTASPVQRFLTFTSGYGIQWDGIGHDGNNLWASQYGSELIHIIDDGVNEVIEEAAKLILELKDYLLYLYNDNRIYNNNGTGNLGKYTSWCNFLDQALVYLGDNDPDGAIERLEHFIGRVEQSVPNHISAADAQILKDFANYIIVLLGGEPVDASDPGIALTVQTVVPSDYYLSEAYPNPFNNQTTIRFGLPEDERVRITVYDMTGRRVATLTNRFAQAGWHSTIWTPRLLANGEYLVRMEAGEFVKTRRLVFLK